MSKPAYPVKFSIFISSCTNISESDWRLSSIKIRVMVQTIRFYVDFRLVELP